MQISDTRRENLRTLAEIHGSSKLAKMLGYRQPSYISQMIGPNPERTVSEKNARAYEIALQLPAGYLDTPLFPVPPQSALPAAPATVQAAMMSALLADAIQVVRRVIQSEGVPVTVDQFAKLLAVEVVEAADNGFKVREQHVKQMLEMLR